MMRDNGSTYPTRGSPTALCNEASQRVTINEVMFSSTKDSRALFPGQQDVPSQDLSLPKLDPIYDGESKTLRKMCRNYFPALVHNQVRTVSFSV